MATRSDGKLNQLQHQLPEGLLADAAWLEAHGYSSALRSQYVSAGWLESPARRVYRRSRAPLTWQQVIISLQTVLDYPLTIGGRTALEQQGYAHYLSADMRDIHIYGPKPPPTWLDDLPLTTKFRWHNSRRLFPDTAALPDDASSITVSADSYTAFAIRYASKERAILELLDELPEHESFHHAEAMMEGLSDLRPRHLQTLLEACASVKVKRLFLFFAERHSHAWLTKLDVSRINLGSGKRVLVKGGKLNAHFNITIPSDLGDR